MSIYGFEKFGERNDWCFYHCHFRKNFPDDLVYVSREKMDEDPTCIAQKKRLYQAMMSNNGNKSSNSTKKCEALSTTHNLNVDEKSSFIPLPQPSFLMPMLPYSQHMLNPYQTAMMPPHPYSGFFNHMMLNAPAQIYYPDYSDYNNNYQIFQI